MKIELQSLGNKNSATRVIADGNYIGVIHKSTVKLYEIWHVGNSEHQIYPLTRILSVIDYSRDEVISTNLQKLQKVCDRLNFIKGEDEKYEIREVDFREYWYATPKMKNGCLRNKSKPNAIGEPIKFMTMEQAIEALSS